MSALVSNFKVSKDRDNPRQICTLLHWLRLIGVGCVIQDIEKSITYGSIKSARVNRNAVGRSLSLVTSIVAPNLVVWLGGHDKQVDEAVRVCSLLASIPVNKWHTAGAILEPKRYHALGI